MKKQLILSSFLLLAAFSNVNAQYFDAKDLKLNGPVKSVNISIYTATVNYLGVKEYEPVNEIYLSGVPPQEDLFTLWNGTFDFNQNGQLIAAKKEHKPYSYDISFEYSGQRLLRVVAKNRNGSFYNQEIRYRYGANGLVSFWELWESDIMKHKYRNTYDSSNILIKCEELDDNGFSEIENIYSAHSLDNHWFDPHLPKVIIGQLFNFDGNRDLRIVHSLRTFDITKKVSDRGKWTHEPCFLYNRSADGDLTSFESYKIMYIDYYDYVIHGEDIFENRSQIKHAYSTSVVKDSYGNWTEMIISHMVTGEMMYLIKRVIEYYPSYSGAVKKPYTDMGSQKEIENAQQEYISYIKAENAKLKARLIPEIKLFEISTSIDRQDVWAWIKSKDSIKKVIDEKVNFWITEVIEPIVNIPKLRYYKELEAYIKGSFMGWTFEDFEYTQSVSNQNYYGYFYNLTYDNIEISQFKSIIDELAQFLLEWHKQEEERFDQQLKVSISNINISKLVFQGCMTSTKTSKTITGAKSVVSFMNSYAEYPDLYEYGLMKVIQLNPKMNSAWKESGNKSIVDFFKKYIYQSN